MLSGISAILRKYRKKSGSTKKRNRSITNRILFGYILVIVVICGPFFVIVSFSLNSLTDTIMFDVLNTTAATAMNSIRESVRRSTDRLYHVRDDNAIQSAVATDEEKSEFIEFAIDSLSFSWVGLYDSQGVLVAGCIGSPDNISDYDIFQRVRRSNNVSFGESTMGNAGLEIAVGLPIHREWLESLYLVGSQRHEALTEILQSIRLGNNYISFIISNEGTLIACNEASTINDIEINTASVTTDNPIVKLINALPAEQRDGAQVISLDGTPMYVTYIPVQGLPWSLSLAVSRADFTGSFNRTLMSVFGMVTVILIISVIVFRLVLSKTLTKPLNQIIESSTLMSQGQFEAHMSYENLNRRDEIGILYERYYVLSCSIQRIFRDISTLTQQASYGNLETRINLSGYEGTFSSIVSEMNSTLEAVCSNLDAMDNGFALLNDNCEIAFSNNYLTEMLMNHNIRSDSDSWLPELITSRQSKVLPLEAQKIFSDNRDGIFTANISLADSKINGSESFSDYSLSLKRVGITNETAAGIKSYSSIVLAMANTTQLTLAIKEADNANRAKSEFLSIMSHEIRTPLNAILGMSKILLQDGTRSSKEREAIEIIYTSGSTLLSIVNDILDISKTEAGMLELVPVEYDLAALINDTVQLNIVRIGDKPIEFVLDVSEHLPSKLYGDELRIKQILNNLISNAIKYSEKGYVKLSVSHLTDMDGVVVLFFAVEDTGHGLREEDAAKLFSAYTRFNSESHRNTEGTGLGLNITKRLTEMMNGSISVESKFGKGTTFKVTIRQKAVDCPPIGAELAQKLCQFTYDSSNRVPVTEITSVAMPYGNVLVVDDIKANLFVAESILSFYKLNIDTAGSGFEAIEKIERGNVYDVIFLDHMMPEMDGLETLKKMREQGYTGTVVALTANAVVGVDEMLMQNGFDDFMSKPIDMQKLDDVLNKYVRDINPDEAKKNNKEIFVQIKPEINTVVNPMLLQVFQSDAEKAVATLRKTVENGDIKLFTTTVHAMKTALANVGEKEMSDAARALEDAALNNNMAFISANAESFILYLEEFSDEHRPVENVLDDTTIEEDVDYLFEQLLVVKTACEDYDSNTAYAALDHLHEKPWKRETAAALEDIRELLFLESDFEAAEKRTNELINKII